ncbi:hypothetical protein [Polaribacter sp. Asnod1-A03]|uniref:hypothetical protein n=1 Tax=Polaribacter sp. Asnod1-A03 TaxID=3160581 RepID=UPI0038632B56
MKKINLLIILTLSILTFISCSENEDITLEENNILFKSYELKRNLNGEYSIDIKVEDNVNIGKVKNVTNNTNEFYLSDSEFVSKQNYGSDLMFDSEKFKIELIADNSNKIPSISIIDDNIVYSEKSSDDYLKEYSISMNEEGSYDLDFTVKDNVSVDFVYDEESDIYEIHLEKSGKSQENNNYTRTFEKQGDILQIDFVNHSIYSSKTEAESFERKPRIIIDEGEDW